MQQTIFATVFSMKIRNLKRMTDSNLVERCLKNDRKAQLELYQNYCDAMFTIAVRYVGQPDEAEDIVQEAFIKMFQKLGDYKREVTLGAWLRKIVVNLAIDKLRVRKNMFVDIGENQLATLTDPDQDWCVEDDVTPQLVRSAIEKLPEAIRYVAQLYLVEGYDHQEISEILKISEVNSRTLLMRGRNKIKEQLKNSMHGTRY